MLEHRFTKTQSGTYDEFRCYDADGRLMGWYTWKGAVTNPTIPQDVALFYSARYWNEVEK